MKVESIEGVTELRRARAVDSRGWFERIFDKEVSPSSFTPVSVSQISISQNNKKFTLRGLHGMDPENPEFKIVECLVGSVFDVVIDLRPNSTTYLDHMTFDLEESNPRAIIIPPGCLHGFLTLTDKSLICYQMSVPYDPSSEIGYRWNEPRFGIEWPARPEHMSEKDLTWSLMKSSSSRF